MLLVADIGNTNITLGVFNSDTLIETFRLSSDKDLSQEEYEILLKTILNNYDIHHCIIASVVNELTSLLKKSIDKLFGINSLLLNSEMNLGIKLNVNNPKEVGADRIANACAAYTLYKKPTIVVDLGTATTIEVVNGNGEFIGGAILPGINMQLLALNMNTSKLPKVECDSIAPVIGNNTNDAILSGVIRGSSYAIDNLLKESEKELNEKATIVATGGFCNVVSKYISRNFDVVNQNLTLEGLKILYELNHKK